MSVEVFNESGRGEINEEELIDVARYAIWSLDVHHSAELSIHIVDTETMADLHVRWMDLPGPTDVMSFPMDELTPGWGRKDGPPVGSGMLGDIMLCPDFAQGQADRAGHSLAHELDLLTVHGVLHLLGYDHITPEDEQRMFSLQNEILANWYDSQEERGVSFAPKPTGAAAFPSAADRDDTRFLAEPSPERAPATEATQATEATDESGTAGTAAADAGSEG